LFVTVIGGHVHDPLKKTVAAIAAGGGGGEDARLLLAADAVQSADGAVFSGFSPAAAMVPSGSVIGRYLRLAAAVIGIYTCYLAYGVFQESLYRLQQDGSSFSFATAFVLFVQCTFNAGVSLAGAALERGTWHHTSRIGGGCSDNHRSLVAAASSMAVLKASAVYVLAMYSSNEALAYVSYPTQALIKSCKMIPVLLGSILINGTRFSLLKYACVLLMTAGIALFQLSGGTSGPTPAESPGGGGPSSQAAGLLLLAVSLCLDGVAGPLQEGLGSMRLTSQEQMLVCNVLAAALMLGVAVALNQVAPSVSGFQAAAAAAAAYACTFENAP